MVARSELSQGLAFVQEQRKAPLCIVEHNFPEELLVFANPSKLLSDVQQATKVQRTIRHAFQATHKIGGETIEGMEVNEENFSTLDRSAYFKRGLGIPLILYFNGSPSKASAFAYPEIAERLAQTIPNGRSLTLLPPDHLPEFLGLFETHHDRVIRYIAVRIGSLDEAEDLASQVFIRGFCAIGSFRDTGAPMEAWLFKIAKNAVIDHLRDRERRPSPVELTETIPATDDPQEQVEKILEIAEEVQWLRSAIQYLSDAQRQVLALKFGAGMTPAEVAEVVGKKPGAVREMQAAAIRKLRSITGQGKKKVKESPVPGSMTFADLAAKLNYSVSSVKRMVLNAEKNGKLVTAHHKIGKKRLFSDEESQQIIEIYRRQNL